MKRRKRVEHPIMIQQNAEMWHAVPFMKGFEGSHHFFFIMFLHVSNFPFYGEILTVVERFEWFD